jgi:hypothetical protein
MHSERILRHQGGADHVATGISDVGFHMSGSPGTAAVIVAPFALTPVPRVGLENEQRPCQEATALTLLYQRRGPAFCPAVEHRHPVPIYRSP